jgi:hypothetical protein
MAGRRFGEARWRVVAVCRLSPRVCAPRLFLALTSVGVSGVQLEHFERPLNDDPIRHVPVTHGFLSEKQAFESDRFYRDAIEFDRLGILA